MIYLNILYKAKNLIIVSFKHTSPKRLTASVLKSNFFVDIFEQKSRSLDLVQLEVKALQTYTDCFSPPYSLGLWKNGISGNNIP